MARLDYRGNAAGLTLTNDLDAVAVSFAVTGDTSGWPTGASGRNFQVVIDRGTAKEEKILCSALAAGTLTVAARGDDGTAEKTHDAGATVEHYGPSASKMDDVDGHVYDTTRDDHAQYARTDGTRAFTGVAAITATPSAVGGGTNQSGSANTLARSDHVHSIGTGGISDSAMFAAGVVNAAALGAASLDVANGTYATGQRPARSVADATALNAVTGMAAGDLAFQVDAAALLGYDGTAWSVLSIAPKQTAVTGGPTSGTTELTLATLTIAALPCTYQVDCAAFWSAYNDVVSDTFTFRIKVGGTTKATIVQRHTGSTNERRVYSVPTSTLTTIAANAAATITVTVQRTGGTGTLTEDTAGLVTARLSFI